MKCFQVSKESFPFEMVEMPIPNPNSEQILIKVLSCRICKGDTSIKNAMIPGVTYPHV